MKRLLWALLALFVTFASFPTLSGVMDAATPSSGPTGTVKVLREVDAASGSQSALQPISNCVAQNRRLAITFLMDESGSLIHTDPTNARVSGLQAALIALTELTSGEAPATVDVNMTGFSVGATQRVPWTPLNSQSLSSLESSAQEFAARNRGFETDYYSALTLAKQELDQQAIVMNPTGTTPVCKMLVWFTDGGLEIDNRVNAEQQSEYGSTVPWAPNIPLTASSPEINGQATDMARQLMCQESSGLVDQIRSDGVFTAIVPLQVEISQANLDFLGAVAQGQSQDGSTTCGTPGATAVASGALISAADVSQLVLDFYSAAVLTPPIPPGSIAKGVCAIAAGACPAGTDTFVVDPSLAKFDVVGVTANSEINVLLTGPSGQSQAIPRGPPGSATVDGALITWTWLSATAVVVTGVLPADVAASWAGNWSVTFVDTTGQNANTVNHVAVYLFGDLGARVAPGTTLRKGMAGPIPIQVVDSTGTVQTNPAMLKNVDVTATIDVAGQPATPLTLLSTGPGTYSANYEPAKNLEASTATVSTELTINTSDGFSLPAVGTTSSVPLLNPLGFPSIQLGKTGILFLSPIRKPGQRAHGAFLLAAGPGATGCAWLTTTKTASAPSGAGVVQYTTSPGNSQSQCVKFHPGEHVPISVAASITGSGTGLVNGTLRMTLSDSVNGATRSEIIPVRFEIDVPSTLDTETAIWLFLIGIFGPLLLLYLVNFFSRRFEKFDQLRFLQAQVHVGGNRETVTVTLDEPLSASKALIFNRPSSLQSFECGEFNFSAHMSPSPFGSVTGRVAAGSDRVITSRGLWRDGRDGIVPLGLGALWAFRISGEELVACLDNQGMLPVPLTGTLLILLNTEDAPGDQVARLVDGALATLPDQLKVVAGKLPSKPSISAPDTEQPLPADDGPPSALPPLPGQSNSVFDSDIVLPGADVASRSSEPSLPPLPGSSGTDASLPTASDSGLGADLPGPPSAAPETESAGGASDNFEIPPLPGS